MSTTADQERATEIITVRFTPSQVRAFNAFRRQRGMTKTALIEDALHTHFTRHGAEFPSNTRRAA